MKRDYKRVCIYGIIMLLCVVVIVVVGWLSQKKIDVQEIEYQNLITANQNSIRTLEEKIAELEKENEELKEQVSQSMMLQSDVTTSNQAFADLEEIYDMFKDGKKEQARTAFKKIEPMGFDDATLAYYEILKDMLEN